MSVRIETPSPSHADGDREELISFQIRDQSFCIDLMAVREIRGWTQATPLPQSPDFIRGVVNLRGTVLPIIDLSARLGLGPTEPSARHAILVTEIADRLVGLLVDGVSEILSLPKESLQPTPDVGCRITREFVRGLVSLDGRMLTLLSLNPMLPAAEAIAA
jgi:purine-binding chemotaxis protein CheW